jgi:hypothetical protein
MSERSKKSADDSKVPELGAVTGARQASMGLGSSNKSRNYFQIDPKVPKTAAVKDLDDGDSAVWLP